MRNLFLVPTQFEAKVTDSNSSHLRTKQEKPRVVEIDITNLKKNNLTS